jgi:hypothetical protein
MLADCYPDALHVEDVLRFAIQDEATFLALGL